MKTRIIYTKIWQDSFFTSLSSEEKIAFIYYLTNDQVNIIHFYECPDRKVIFDTGISLTKLLNLKGKLQTNKKIFFYKDYVFLVNAIRYESYTGEKNEEAKRKTIQLLSSDVLAWYKDIIDRGIDRGIDTQPIPSINNNIEIINNNKGVVKGEFSTFESLTDLILEEISSKYKVPLSFVKSKLDDMKLWHEQNPRRNNKQNWKATLMNWVKRDALKIIYKERQTINKFSVTKV